GNDDQGKAEPRCHSPILPNAGSTRRPTRRGPGLVSEASGFGRDGSRPDPEEHPEMLVSRAAGRKISDGRGAILRPVPSSVKVVAGRPCAYGSGLGRALQGSPGFRSFRILRNFHRIRNATRTLPVSPPAASDDPSFGPTSEESRGPRMADGYPCAYL